MATKRDADVPLNSSLSRDDDILVFVLGDTGTGKSTFINYVVKDGVAPIGHDMAPETVAIRPFVANHPTDSRRRFILVDTLGFDTVTWEDYDVLRRVAKWLKKSYPAKGAQRRIAILYLVEIDQRLVQKNRRPMSPSTLFLPGIARNMVIVTTKWSNLPRKGIGQQQEKTLTTMYKRQIPVHSFHDTSESAREIIDRCPRTLVNIADFRFKLKKALPAPKFRPTASIAQLLTSLRTRLGNNTTSQGHFSLISADLPPLSTTGSLSVPGNHGTFPKINNIARLDKISARLKAAFQDTSEYKRLLSCQVEEAQALLDTFQLILGMGQSDDQLRRNLIVATKRLSSKTDMYPTLFFLTDVWRPDSTAVDSGAYADIYKGRYQGKDVCLKVIRVYKAKEYKSFVKLVAREAILWGQLSHPNLLPFYGLYRFDDMSPVSPATDYMHNIWSAGRGKLCLVSPWAEKGNVVEFLIANPNAQRLLLCLDIAAGVEYLHDNDIVHGDLKGINVLVDQSHRAYIADFGFSAVDDPEIKTWASQSVPQSKGGTVRWQAPELLPDPAVQDELSSGGDLGPQNTKATDVYAWSCVCYEIFTSQVPFFGIKSVISNILKGERPTRGNNTEKYAEWGLTEEIWGLMADCWKHDPADRPNMREALLRLRAVPHEDNRRSREWGPGLAMCKKDLGDSIIPLTLEQLNKIISSESITNDGKVTPSP